ncbi:MAG: ABC transporter permease [Clostridiales bacterium]|nr:ABC transporter permease [Clostridiales bacterium]
MKRYHLVRRPVQSLKRLLIYYLIGLVISLGIGAVLLASLGINPFEYYGRMFTIGMVGNKYAYKNIEGFLKVLVPLLITSLALGLSFKMRFWNIGGEGEFLIGAISAAIVAFNVTGLPRPVTIILMCIAAMISSGLLGIAIAFFKVKFNTNETLVTLMLNYIMLYVITYLGKTKENWNFFLDPKSARPIFGKFPESAIMDGIKIGNFNLLWSVVVAAVLVALIYVYLKYTKHGYEIAVVGDSAATAKYAGMKVGWIIMRTMFISSALIGLAAGLTASASGTISETITNNVGWTGIVVAWLGKLSTPAIAVTSVLIAILQFGCKTAATKYPSIDSNFADLMQGIILFSVLTADFAATFTIKKKEDAKNA